MKHGLRENLRDQWRRRKGNQSHQWTEGNSVELLENGEAYYPSVMAAIGAAQKEIFVETFIIFEDKIGTPFKDALLAAAQRGCRVELTVDGYGSADLSPQFVQELADAGIGFHVYRPQMRLFGFRANIFKRLHRKIVVVDCKIAFVGGINISHEHVADYGEGSKQDYAVRVEGPVVHEIHRFCELSVAKMVWNSRSPGDLRRRWWQRHKKVPPTPPLPAVGRTRARFVVRDNDRHKNDIERQYRDAIKAARSRIIIANAYFFPGYRLLRNLHDASRRGVDVTLILQGKPDMWYVQWVAQNLYSYLIKAGVTIYEYCERPLHAKVAVIDDEWATVGSSNLDPLSLYLNLESNLVFRDAAFNNHLASRLRYLMQHTCRKVEEEAIPRRHLGRQLFALVTYHIGRRFPRWSGWRPAHANQIGQAAGDTRAVSDERQTPGAAVEAAQKP